MSGLELEVYEIFKKHFSEKEAEKIIEFCRTKSEERMVKKKDAFGIKCTTSDLIAKIESSKNSIIKWMFIFWIGQLAAVAGILFALFNVYLKK